MYKNKKLIFTLIFAITFMTGFTFGNARQPPVVYKVIEVEKVIKESIIPTKEEPKEIHFNPDNVTEISNATIEEIDDYLVDTELYGLGKAYIEAEQEYGMNALFLIGLTALESSWGNSRLAKEKKNISSFAAYDNDPFNAARTFDSKEECILVTAKWLSREYLNPEGKHYNGLSVEDINKKYAKDKKWHKKIISIVNSFE